ncbi:MAG: nicotinate-nucleotide diphosphorylase (carboxylating) [Methanomicrobiales archaeon HGW-Methanomicrobiales-4]|nr:MAG: nicotinate-nucleotide diphosphorylase (carboxylating) [Methanomicrobiales archaeon HGW-Methanomicrobiales-4]
MIRAPEIPLSRLIAFVEEDAPFGDLTTESILPAQSCIADIKAREELILAGLSEMVRLFTHYGVQTETTLHDGDSVRAGSTILTISGDVHSILLIERTSLNLVGRMSGIATRTRQIQEMVTAVNPSCRIAATRKTAPGLRILDKKAAMIGGADPHRYSLSDAILIKDTHRALISLKDAISRARAAGIYHRIEAEAESIEDAIEAAQAGAEIILLDNMEPAHIQKTIQALKDLNLRNDVLIELSGGITPDTIHQYAALEVDRISLGMLTHTVRNADLSLEIRH